MDTGFNRRNFLKGAVAGAAAVASMGVMGGCAGGTPSENDTQKNGESELAPEQQAARDATLVEYESEVAEKVVEEKECDIVVLGSGAGGLGAAVKAAELGARVILLEKAGALGGSTAGTEGMFGYGSKLQALNGIELPLVADLIEDELIYTNYRIDPILWKRFILASGKAADWLMDNGYEFGAIDTYNDDVSSFKCFHWWMGWEGVSMIEFLQGRAEELGVEILTETPGICLMTDNGTVTGVYGYSNKDNHYLAVKAKATIVGTGGFGSNNALIEQHTAWDMTHGSTRSNGTGDGVVMAEDIGAQPHMSAILPRTSVEGYTVYDEIVMGICNSPLFFVNENGDRFMNEGVYVTDYMAVFVNAIISQKAAYTIVDQALIDDFSSGDGIISDFGGVFYVGDKLPSFQEQIEECISSGRGNAFKGETIEELAEAMGIDPAHLKETIERYNELCDKQSDEDYLKDPNYLIPVKTGPFYAVRQDPCVTNTIGGLDVNYDNAVLNTQGEVIPSLYCVGVDSCKLYKESYNYAMSGGLVSYSLYSGLNAAQHAFDTYCD